MKIVVFESFLIVLISVLVSVKCAKILGVFSAPGYSQFILAETLMLELANRGHEVTVISPFSPKNPPSSYKTVLINETLGFSTKEYSARLFKRNSVNVFSTTIGFYKFGTDRTENCLRNKGVQELLASSEKFDLVIVEHFINDAQKAFAAHFKAPLVLFSSMGITEWTVYPMQLPIFPSFNTLCFSANTNQMNFFNRIKNVVAIIFDYFYRHYYYFPKQQELIKKYFPGEIKLDHVLTNASLMLMNSHVTTSENVLHPYNMIEIGGFHIKTNPLSKEVQKFLDEATDGAILLSLGTNVRSADLSEDKLNAFLKVLGSLKEKVLWKFETDLPNKPHNVLISKWLKQSDILAHPNIKLFITHCGLLSVTEAIYHGVPMVGIPLFGDQHMNIARASSLQIANKINLNDVTEDTFSLVLNETLNDPKYRINMKKMSELMKDRPMKPLDLAMYWIEYVLRHQGLRFEAASSKLYWFQLYSFDVLFLALFNLFLLFKVIKMCVETKKENKLKLQ